MAAPCGSRSTSRVRCPASRNAKARLTANAVFVRNAMRELEVYVPLIFIVVRAHDLDAWVTFFGVIWSAVFVFFPLFNRDRLRVGDVVAGLSEGRSAIPV